MPIYIELLRAIKKILERERMLGEEDRKRIANLERFGVGYYFVFLANKLKKKKVIHDSELKCLVLRCRCDATTRY